jgi:hypothetical protein
LAGWRYWQSISQPNFSRISQMMADLLFFSVKSYVHVFSRLPAVSISVPHCIPIFKGIEREIFHEDGPIWWDEIRRCYVRLLQMSPERGGVSDVRSVRLVVDYTSVT